MTAQNMGVTDALAVLDAIHDAGLKVWLDGGWGVDALLGRQTRDHGDVDIVIELPEIARVFDALEPLGYTLEEDLLPTRAVLRAVDGRQVDIHPVTFDEFGVGWQRDAHPGGGDCPYPADGFGVGAIAGRPVPCLTAMLQIEHHLGYEPRDHDRADMAALALAFGLDLPHPY